jgi:hypothetical protein
VVALGLRLVATGNPDTSNGTKATTVMPGPKKQRKCSLYTLQEASNSKKLCIRMFSNLLHAFENSFFLDSHLPSLT